MIGWIITLCVLAVLTVLLLLRVGVQVEYGRDALAVRLRIGPGYLQVIPGKPKKETRRKKSKKTKPKKEPLSPKGGRVDLILSLLPLVLRTVKRLCGRLRVDKLDLILKAGAEDPGDAAMQYGRANALLGALWQPIVDTCRVKDGHARVEVDFDAKHPLVYLLAEATLRVGQGLALAVAFAVQALIILARKTNKTTPN